MDVENRQFTTALDGLAMHDTTKGELVKFHYFDAPSNAGAAIAHGISESVTKCRRLVANMCLLAEIEASG